MKHCKLFFVILFCFGSLSASAQGLLDFQTGQAEIKGPRTIALTDITFDNQLYSIMLQLNLDGTWSLVGEPDIEAELLDLAAGSVDIAGPNRLHFKHLGFDGANYDAVVQIHLDSTWSVSDIGEASEIPDNFSYQNFRDLDVQIAVKGLSGNPMQYVGVNVTVPNDVVGEAFSLTDDTATVTTVSADGSVIEIPDEFINELDSNTVYELAQGQSLSEGQTNADGLFQQTIRVPAHLKAVRITVSAIGLSQNTVELPIAGNTLSYTFDGQSTPVRQRRKYSYEKLKGKVYNADWQYLHGIDDVTTQAVSGDYDVNQYDSSGLPLSGYLPSPVPITDELLNRISIALPEGKRVPDARPYYLTDDDSANLLVHEEGEVFITFLHEGAGFRNSFGFFTYQDGETPTVHSAIDNNTIIFPNASYHNAGGSSNGLYVGDTISLGTFTPGTRIGFFVVANGWLAPNSNWQGGIKPWMTPQHDWVFYTLKHLNSEPEPAPGTFDLLSNDLRRHTILLDGGQEDGIVLAIEDVKRTIGWCDQDFNDLVFLIHANPVTTISRSNLTALPEPIDTDDDGVFDANDSFPEDPDRAFVSYYPGADTEGTLAFEDLWPNEGDYDMNDLKLSYVIAETLDANRNVKSIQATFQIKARGAGLENGFGVAFGFLPPTTAANATFVLNNGVPTGLSAEANQDRLSYILLQNAHQNSPTLPGCSVFNTQQSCDEGVGDTFTLTLTFDTPQARNAVGYPPYNPFIFRSNYRGLEVHLPDRSPTGLMDLALVGTQDDTSNYQIWRFFKTQDNLPWALDIPAPWRHPAERISITHTYFSFFNWAQSGGQQDWDWYVKNFQEQNLYK